MTSSRPTTTRRIARAVRVRYDAAARGTDSLSCGRALERAALRPGERVVDLGCGRGGEVLRAAALVGPAGRAIRIDAAPAMLAAARSAARRARARNVAFRAGRLDALPLPDASVDVVLSNCAVNHAPDKTAVFREIARVLRPGGRVVIADIVAVRPVPRRLPADPAAWADCCGGAETWRDLRLAVRRAGFPPPLVVARSAPYRRRGVILRSVTLVLSSPSRYRTDPDGPEGPGGMAMPDLQLLLRRADVRILQASLKHCLATCHVREQNPRAPCPDCDRVRDLLRRVGRLLPRPAARKKPARPAAKGKKSR